MSRTDLRESVRFDREALTSGRERAKQAPASFNWITVDLAAIDEDELRELLEDAWRIVVPQSVAAHFGD